MQASRTSGATGAGLRGVRNVPVEVVAILSGASCIERSQSATRHEEYEVVLLHIATRTARREDLHDHLLVLGTTR